MNRFLEFACTNAKCAPPPVGTGGSTKSTTSAPPNETRLERRARIQSELKMSEKDKYKAAEELIVEHFPKPVAPSAYQPKLDLTKPENHPTSWHDMTEGEKKAWARQYRAGQARAKDIEIVRKRNQDPELKARRAAAAKAAYAARGATKEERAASLGKDMVRRRSEAAALKAEKAAAAASKKAHQAEMRAKALAEKHRIAATGF